MSVVLPISVADLTGFQGDETDTLNESYICFRRREMKAVRKTRATQITTSDKLSRLQQELENPLKLAVSVLLREKLKQEHAKQSQAIWEMRSALVQLKHENPTLGDKVDAELFIDKERTIKKPEPMLVLSCFSPSSRTSYPPLRPAKNVTKVESGRQYLLAELALRPLDRLAILYRDTERELAACKERDHNWEDLVDVSFTLLARMQPTHRNSSSIPIKPRHLPSPPVYSSLYRLPPHRRSLELHPRWMLMSRSKTLLPVFRHGHSVCGMDVVVGRS